jgi:hypothetical protein
MELRDRSSISGYHFSSWLTILADTLSDIKGFIYADATEVGTEVGLGDGREAHRCSSLRPQDDVAPSFIQTEGCLPLPTFGNEPSNANHAGRISGVDASITAARPAAP